MKIRTYFCSDSHFNHPNILKYEPKRVEAISNYIIKNCKEYDFLLKLDAICRKHNYFLEGEYVVKYNIECQVREGDHYNFIREIIFNILKNENYLNDESEESENMRSLRKELIKVILNYQTELFIYNWNEVVKDNDLVYFLGDFGFGNDKELEEIGRRLKGHKTIIIGNHDGRKYNSDKTIIYNPTLINHFKACGFERVEFNPIILKGCFILSHEPLYYMNESMPYFNIYGHVHSNPMFKTKTENSLCACLDRWNYFPIEIKEYDEYIPE